MTFFANRPLALMFLSLPLAACAGPVPADASPATPALGVDLGPSGPVRPGAAEGYGRYPQHRAAIQEAHEGHLHANGTGTVNAVDPAQHKLSITHQPIPAIGFPAMTMDFAVAPTISLNSVKPGTKIDFTIEQGADGMYVIQSIAPASGGAR